MRTYSIAALSVCLVFVAWQACGLAAEAFRAEAFSPESWPGTAGRDVQVVVQPPMKEYLQTLRQEDRTALSGVRDRMVAALGPFAGVPEERPEYGTPINPEAPSLGRIERLYVETINGSIADFGWHQAAKLQTSPGAGGKVPRLRISQRQIQALLELHEAGLDDDGEYLRHAVAGLDYLLSAQAKSGAFGYPYEPGGPGLRRQAAAAVERGEREGRTMVEREWVIDGSRNRRTQFR